MAAHTINLIPVDLGSGWKATKAWETDGPIVLIQAESPTEEVFTRLDTQKFMFLDSLPVQAKEDDIRNLVARVHEAVALDVEMDAAVVNSGR